MEKTFVTTTTTILFLVLASAPTWAQEHDQELELERPRTVHLRGEDAANVGDSAEQAKLDAEAQDALDQIVVSYLEVHRRLADDQVEGVVAELGKLHDAAHALFKVESPEVEQRARALSEMVHSQPNTLEDARAVFKALSPELIKLVDLVPPSDEAAASLYEAYCPMAKASWIQITTEVVNPYMGSSMLRCGEIKRTIKSSERE